MNQALKIVIADDHPIFRRGLCEVIETDPDLVLAGQAGDGDAALRAAQDLQPDVMVLDVTMPKLTGLQVARRLQELASPVKLVLLTMHEDESLLNQALDLGISAYVLKDNAAEDLLAAIRAVVRDRTFISPSLSGLVLRRRDRGEALRREKPGLDRLTQTERRILRLISEDRTTKEIAGFLGCAVRTVETHRQNISAKLELSGSHSLLKFAYDKKSQLGAG